MGQWPWPTFVVNIVGALLLGYFHHSVAGASAAVVVSTPLLGTGMCGGLTTFSTVQVETVQKGAAHAVAYTTASMLAGARRRPYRHRRPPALLWEHHL